MRKLILKMSVTVDGFVGGPNGELDWLFKSMNKEIGAWIVDTLWQAGTHIMGSRTYQDMVAYWPTSTEPFAAPMNEIPKAIFSRHGLGKPGAEATTNALKNARAQYENGPAAMRPSDAIMDSWLHPAVFGGDLVEDIGTLKKQPGKDILAHGGAGFARSLVKSRLIDEYRLVVHPVAIGKGLSLFSDLPEPLHLELAGTTTFPSGAVAQIYRPKAYAS